MGKKEAILEKMRALEPWDKLDDSSKAALYQAFPLWKSEAGKSYNQLTKSNWELEQKNKTLTDENAALSTKHASLRQVVAAEEGKLEGIRLKHEAEKLEYAKKKEQHDAIHSALADLSKRNITEATVSAVASVDASSSEELLARVKTLKQYEELQKENERLKENILKLKTTIAAEQAQKENISKEKEATEAKLGEFRREYAIYLELLNVQMSYYRQGYGDEIFRSLLVGLKRFEVPSDPKGSIRRLLSTLGKVRNIEELDSAITSKTSEHQAIQGKVDELKGTITAYRDTVVASIREVSGASIQSIQGLQNQCLTSMNTLHTNLQKNFAQIVDTSSKDRAALVNRFNWDLRNSENEIRSTHLLVKQSLEIYEEDIKKWGEIRRTSGYIERQMQLTAIVFAAVKDPEQIKLLPSEYAVSLLKALHIYVSTRLPGAETLPSPQLYQKERWGFNSVYKVKVSSLSEWLLEDLTNRLMEGKL